MLFSRDNLKNFDTIMCLFDRFVNHVIYFFFFLLFIICRFTKKKKKKKKQRQKRTNGQKSLGKNPEAVKWISDSER